MKSFYLGACVVGFIVPYAPFVLWLLDNGLDPVAFGRSVVEHRIGLFAWLDVLVSAVVLLQFVTWEASRLQMKQTWVVVLATVTVGVSLGLPLFLYLRERRFEAESTSMALFEA